MLRSSNLEYEMTSLRSPRQDPPLPADGALRLCGEEREAYSRDRIQAADGCHIQQAFLLTLKADNIRIMRLLIRLQLLIR